MSLEFLINTTTNIRELVYNIPNSDVKFEAHYSFLNTFSVQVSGSFICTEAGPVGLIMRSISSNEILQTFDLVCTTANEFLDKNSTQTNLITVIKNGNKKSLNATYIGGDQFQIDWANINVLSRIVDPLTGIAHIPNSISIFNQETGSINTSYFGKSGTGVIGVPGGSNYTLEIASAYVDATGGPGGTSLLLVGQSQATTVAIIPGNNPLSNGNSTQSDINPRDYAVSFDSTDSGSRTYAIDLVQPNTVNLIESLGSYVSTNGQFAHTLQAVIPSDVINNSYDILVRDIASGDIVRVGANIVVTGYGDITPPVFTSTNAYWDEANEQLVVSYVSLIDSQSGIYSARLNINDGTTDIINNLNIKSNSLEYFNIPKNGKTYTITLTATNYAGLQTTETITVIVPTGFGAAGFGRGGFGR